MTFLEKQKVKSRLTIVAFAVFGLFIGWISDASALPGYFNNAEGCSDAGCHDNAVTESCDGCHAHGAHAASASGAMNITASTNKSTYTVDETITVTLSGGGKGSWFRALLYDSSGNEIDRSSGCANIDLTGATVCDDGSDFSGATLTVLASTLGTGDHNITAAWFGNSFDRAAGLFGDDTITSVTTPGWIEDAPIDATKPASVHGKEIVAVTPFTINDAPPASSGGGGGSLSWPVLGLLLFVITGMLLRDRQANLISVTQRKID